MEREGGRVRITERERLEGWGDGEGEKEGGTCLQSIGPYATLLQ